MRASGKRAEYVSVTGLGLSIILYGVSFVLSRWNGSAAIFALSWQMLAAAVVWLGLVILFHQQTLAERERLEAEALAGKEAPETIFQRQGERTAIFAVAQRRLKLLEKWFLPVFAGLIAVYEVAVGLYLFRRASTLGTVELNQSLVTAVYMAAIAFVSFLVSRYALGMSSQRGWQSLRAGGSYLCVLAIECFVISISLVLAQFKFPVVIDILAWVIPAMLIALGCETGLNIVLDIYRPKFRGEYVRCGFDSRVLALISQPGPILRSAAGAIDYQFGFRVSQTWFYKLVEKAIIPLVIFSAFSMYLLSCFVIVGPDEEAIIERFGRPISASSSSTFGPGLTVKWPWPIDIAYKHPARRMRQINVGFVAEEGDSSQRRPFLWGQQHYKEEYDLLVATESGLGQEQGPGVPISLVRAAVPVQYTIKDTYAYMYNHREPDKVLEAICYRQLIQFAASAKIETPNVASGKSQSPRGTKESILGAGRAEAARILKERIQAAADEEGLGVQIVFVGLQGVHPPQDVAKEYRQVVGAIQEKQASILKALSDRNKALGEAAGSVESAEQLYRVWKNYQQAKDSGDPAKLKEAVSVLDEAIEGASGEVFSRLAEARQYAFEKATVARGTGERFKDQLKAFRAAPEIYKHEQRLAMLEEGLEGVRKYVVVADPNDLQVFIIDVKDKLTPSLYDITGVEKTE